MSQKQHLFLSPLTIPDFLKGYTLLLCFLLCYTHGSTQDRSTLEAERMSLFEEIERIETNLTQTRIEKADLLTQIKKLDDKITNGDIRAKISEPETTIPQTPAVVISQDVPARIGTIPANQDYTSSYNELLQQHLRTKLFNKSQAQPSQEDLQKELREISYINSIREFINQHPVQKLDNESIPDFVSNDIIEEEPTELEIPLVASESATPEKLTVKEINQLKTQVAELRRKENQLTSKLNQLQTSVERVNQEIDQVLISTLTLRTTPRSNTPSQSTQTTSVPTTNNFSQIDYKKGFLPWPIKNPEVTSRYGQQEHSKTFNVFVNNNGIDIASQSTNVLAIYEGEVLSVTYDDKSLATIIIQHSGDVYSVYSQLSIARVKKGEQVGQAQLLGAASEKPSGKADLHFEIWKGEQSENPLHWLKNN